MATAVKTTVTELPESRVRVEAEVPPQEVAAQRRRGRRHARAATCACPASARARCPPPVVIQRVGREAVLDEAVRGALRPLVRRGDRRGRHPPGRRARRRPRRPARRGPAADLHDRDRRAPDRATLGDIQGPRGRRGASPTSTRRPSTAELEQLRERSRRLETVERAAGQRRLRRHRLRGLDRRRATFEGGEGRDHLLELGSGRFIPGFEEQLVGAEGRRRAHGLELTFPDDYGARRTSPASEAPVRGRPSRRSRRKQLPELDDDFATEAGGFDSLDELREDIASRTARGRRAARSRPSSARPRWTPSSRTRPSRSPTRSSRPARASCGTRCCTRSRTRASPRTPTSR